VKNKQKMKEISRSKQASPQKSQSAIEVKKPKTSMPKKSNSERLIKNRRHTEAKKLARADKTNREQPQPSRRVKPDCINPLGVIQRDSQTEGRIRDELESRWSGYESNQDRSLRRSLRRNSSSSCSRNNHRLVEQSRRQHRSRCNFPVSQYRQSSVSDQYESDGENFRPSRDMRRIGCRHYSSSKENA